MAKGKHGTTKKKTVVEKRIDKSNKDDKEDNKLQLIVIQKKDIPTKINAQSNVSGGIPLVAKITKECDGSISTDITSNETDNSGYIGSPMSEEMEQKKPPAKYIPLEDFKIQQRQTN